MVETYPEKRLIAYARVSTYGQTLDSQLELYASLAASSIEYHQTHTHEPLRRAPHEDTSGVAINGSVGNYLRRATVSWPPGEPCGSSCGCQSATCQNNHIHFDIANAVRRKFCLATRNNIILAAMIANGSPERARRPKRCSHRNRRSASRYLLNPRRRATTNRRGNRVSNRRIRSRRPRVAQRWGEGSFPLVTE
jgi:hypothetical protein